MSIFGLSYSERACIALQLKLEAIVNNWNYNAGISSAGEYLVIMNEISTGKEYVMCYKNSYDQENAVDQYTLDKRYESIRPSKVGVVSDPVVLIYEAYSALVKKHNGKIPPITEL